MYSFNMLGLDTFERIGIDYGRGDMFDALPLALRAGPKVDPHYVDARPGKTLYLYPHHLKLLYDRFRAAKVEKHFSGKGILGIACEALLP